jgi:hypothetical protein
MLKPCLKVACLAYQEIVFNLTGQLSIFMARLLVVIYRLAAPKLQEALDALAPRDALGKAARYYSAGDCSQDLCVGFLDGLVAVY